MQTNQNQNIICFGEVLWNMFPSGAKLYEHPGFKVKAADTVGAGDSFFASLKILYHKLHSKLPVQKGICGFSQRGCTGLLRKRYRKNKKKYTIVRNLATPELLSCHYN